MSISRKYPAFLLLTTVGTAFAIFFAMHEVLRSTYEKEIIKGGSRLAEALAGLSGPALSVDNEKGLQRILKTLIKDTANVLDARIADENGRIIASLMGSGINDTLPEYLRDPKGPNYYADPNQRAYHLRAGIWHEKSNIVAGVEKIDKRLVGYFILTLSRTPLDAALLQARKRALIFASGVATVMFIFGLLLMRREVRILRIIMAAFENIARGDFSQPLEIKRKDEIGELASGFNYMLKRIELFSRYNDKIIIDRLIADESLARPGGRLREVSVLFGDMRGYTAMSNRRTADQVVRIVNTYFHLFIECVAFWGGVVDKTMGDAIMALFERPDGDPADTHKRRALLALCYMKASSRVLNHFLYTKRSLGEDLDVEAREFGFAMATGRAIVGNIGSERHMDYTVCGRVVNLGARLEGMTKNGEVIIDNFTLKGTSDLVLYKTLPAVQPKGFTEAEMVIPHRIVSLADDEAQRLRIFLKKLFTYSFVRQMLMPGYLTVGEAQSWCKDAEMLLLKLIAETATEDFFTRVDIETGCPLDQQYVPLT
ncbi:MAG: HAMP domain-containing protein [Deltaproteobacteria bacterium]|nr:HAMP domain-containing protein [Deltaproteobacteria bacterium]